MPENSIISFDSTDKLGLKPFCEKLENYLLIDHDYVEGGLVIGLNAGFGAGKTTFVEMWTNDLLSRRSQGQDVPQPVVLNAWKSDYCGDPLSAILAGLIDAVQASSATAKDKEALKDAAKDAAWFITGLANQVAAKWTGINVIEAAEFAEGKKVKIPDFIELFQQRANALETLKNRLIAVFGSDAPRVFVFVDELDRCRPDYAVNYLETIKHVFDIHGMVFVLAIDYDHLANSAKALFGQDLKFEEYFRKFCHRVIALPKPNEQGLGKLAGAYIEKYLEIQHKRACGISLRGESLLSTLVELAVGLRMTPRQLQEAFRVAGHACSVKNEEARGKILVARTSMILLFSFLRVADDVTYNKIKNKEMPHEDVGRLLIKLVGKENADWWFKVYLTGIKWISDERLAIEQILQKVGFLAAAQQFSDQDVAAYSRIWSNAGITDDLIGNTFHRIESMDSF